MLRQLSLSRTSRVAFAWFCLVAPAGCQRHGGRAAPGTPAVRLDEVLVPARASEALHRLGGAHLHAVLRMSARPAVAGAATDADGGTAAGLPPVGATPDVTTTTDLWLDKTGAFRLDETNDAGGQRRVTVLGRDLYASIAGGRTIKRTAEPPEPEQLVAQAAGGPWALWELVRDFAAVEALPTTKVNGRPAAGFRFSAAGTKPSRRQASPDHRKWRDSLVLDQLSGELLLDEATSAPLHAELKAAYAFSKGADIFRGEMELRLDVDQVGTAPPVVAPADGRDLPLRQRAVPEEQALLKGLPASAGRGGTKAPR